MGARIGEEVGAGVRVLETVDLRQRSLQCYLRRISPYWEGLFRFRVEMVSTDGNGGLSWAVSAFHWLQRHTMAVS